MDLPFSGIFGYVLFYFSQFVFSKAFAFQKENGYRSGESDVV